MKNYNPEYRLNLHRVLHRFQKLNQLLLHNLQQLLLNLLNLQELLNLQLSLKKHLFLLKHLLQQKHLLLQKHLLRQKHLNQKLLHLEYQQDHQLQNKQQLQKVLQILKLHKQNQQEQVINQLQLEVPRECRSLKKFHLQLSWVMLIS